MCCIRDIDWSDRHLVYAGIVDLRQALCIIAALCAVASLAYAGMNVYRRGKPLKTGIFILLSFIFTAVASGLHTLTICFFNLCGQ